ncbi:MAG: NAD-dependent deacylase [Chloroflexota bacterium]|nr:NAD-dependent deacylase [Chloroflexota bacterium]
MEDLIQQAAIDLVNSKYAIALTGAGMSTESGIRDFRGPQGIWTTDKEAEAKAYKRYDLFLENPKAYWNEMLGEKGTHGAFYREIRNAQPNTGHRGIAELSKMGIIKCVITQNVDGLHEKAGAQYVINYHGTVHKLRCHSCGLRFNFEDVSIDKIPPPCKCGGIIKYDVVHFKEPIPMDIMEQAQDQAMQCDVMIICGTSAVVYPFAGLPRMARQCRGSQLKIIEVNEEPTPLTLDQASDYLIQGKIGEILPEIVRAIERLPITRNEE